ncbi:MAG: choice-of-anchor L domain-containing protein [Bacteroidota bacterium]
MKIFPPFSALIFCSVFISSVNFAQSPAIAAIKQKTIQTRLVHGHNMAAGQRKIPLPGHSAKKTSQNMTLEYCNSGADTSADYISHVQFGSIQNSSYCQNGGYSDYSSLSTTCIVGDTLVLFVINGEPSPMTQCGVWIDWNHNGSFLDDNPIVVTGGPTVFTANVIVPLTAEIGDLRIRIVMNRDQLPMPCGSDHFGETEDYTLDVVPVFFHEVEIVQYVRGITESSYPISYYPEVWVYNVGDMVETNIPIHFIFNDTTIINDTITDTLNPDDELYYQFSQAITISSCGIYPFIAFTSIPIPNDMDFDDDTVQDNFVATKYLSVNPIVNVPNTFESIFQGNGVIMSNISFTGASGAIGSFSAACTKLGLDTGIVISTGLVTTAIGPNDNTAAGQDLGLPGDSLLSAMINATTHDAAILECDIKPLNDWFQFSYVFGSEEYPELINQTNDCFAIYISGPKPGGGDYHNTNMALIPGSNNIAVGINTINYGYNDAGICMNCQYYVKNYRNEIQLDSYTTPLMAGIATIPGATYHLRIAIADGDNTTSDSYLFIQAGSLSSSPEISSVNGYIKYDNFDETPLSGVTVRLMQNDSVLSETVTNQYGMYSFNNVSSGNYSVRAESNASWGGVNSADALMIIKYFVSLLGLSGLPLLAADVNDDNVVNSKDALLVVKRFTGVILEYPMHRDWVFETHSIIVPGIAPVSCNIKGLCYGDVNGSYIPQ